MIFFGVIFIVSTTLVLIFKKEENVVVEDTFESHLSVKDTYKCMWRILWLAPVKKLILILMTVKVCEFLAKKMIIACY
jgi:PAT family acetyl-CoA transporter-like MFS transporter 1